MRVDKYTLGARVFPVVVVLAPVYLALAAWLRGRVVSVEALGAVVGVGIIGFLLAQLGRDQGKKLEPELWREWGGPPTTLLLRHGGAANPTLLALWHGNIQRITGLGMPTVAEEAAAPVRADQLYAAAVSVLRDKTRDGAAFPLVLKENISYGFRRNLVAMRPTGMVLALAGTITCLWIALSSNDGSTQTAWGAGIVCAGLLALWLVRFHKDWIKPVAFAYAERLLEATGKL